MGETLNVDQYQMLPVTGPGQPVSIYRMTHSLWLHLLDLCVHGKDQAAHQGWLPPALSLGTGLQKARSTARSTFTCLHLLAACQSQSLKEPLVVLWLHNIVSQQVTKQGKVVFTTLITGSNLVQVLGLRPLSKSPRTHHIQLSFYHVPTDLCGRARSQGVLSPTTHFKNAYHFSLSSKAKSC